MTTRTVVLRFDALSDNASTMQAVIAGLAGLFGGGFGVQWLKGWQERRSQRHRSEQGFEVKILDEGAALRQELHTRAERLQAQVVELLERAHRAELQVASVTAENAQLRDRLSRSHTVTDGLLKLRGSVQPGAEKADGAA